MDAETVTRSVWTAMAAGDRQGAAQLFSQDLVWHLDAGGDHAMSGDYAGWAANGHLQRLIHEESRGTFRAEAVTFQAAGPELVAVTVRVNLETDGGTATMPGVWVARVREGKVVEVWDIVRPVPDTVRAEAARAVAQLGLPPA